MVAAAVVAAVAGVAGGGGGGVGGGGGGGDAFGDGGGGGEVAGDIGADAGDGDVLEECIPSPEICNHIDDDCDGFTDEDDTSQPITKELCDDQNPCTSEYCDGEDGCKYELLSGNECDVDACTVDEVCVEGVCVGSPIECDDLNDCTADDCDLAAGCVYYPITGQDCDDSDLCTANDNCISGDCVGKMIICNDGNLCTDDSCLPADGCTYTPNNDACDDGNMCTGPDLCEAGECAGADLSCECLTDSECSSFEDGNLCNGTLYCDTTKAPFECQVSAGTVVQCPVPQGPDGPCLDAVCAPGSGECSTVPANDGAACDDGNPCTAADECSAGVCAGLVPVVCNDANGCTDDSCNPAVGCVYDPNSATCDDGDFCTLGDSCQGGACQPGQALDCADDNSCTLDGCNADATCSHLLLDALPCDDGDVCTKNDVCVVGQCTGTPFVDCCTADADCADDNPCTENLCNLNTGECQALTAGLNGAPCDADATGCTADDQCAGGVCTAGAQVECPLPDNVCLYAVCMGTGPDSYDCVAQPFAEGTPCDDGLACNVGSTCQPDATCGGGLVKTIMECTDEIGIITTCLAGLCVEPDGCTPSALPDGTPCLLPHVSIAQCAEGECGIVECAEGYGNCDGVTVNGCETDLINSNDNCGACGLPCGPGAPPNVALKCEQGECVFDECLPGWADADGDCAGDGQCVTGCEAPGCLPLLGGDLEIPDDGIDNDCDGGDAVNSDSRGFYVDPDFPFGVACETPGLGSRLCPFNDLGLAMSHIQFEQDWSAPGGVKKELYVAKGIYFETGPVAVLVRPMLLLGGYQRTAQGPWSRDVENNVTFLESDFEEALAGEWMTAPGWAVVDGVAATPTVSAAGRMVLRRLNTSDLEVPVEVIVEAGAKDVHVLDSSPTQLTGAIDAKNATISGNNLPAGFVAAQGVTNWLFSGNAIVGDFVAGADFELIDNVVAGSVSGGANCTLSGNQIASGVAGVSGWTLAGNQVTGPVNGQANWELAGNTVVGPVTGKNGWTLTGNTITGTVAGQNDWNLDGNIIFGDVSGTQDSWDLTRNVVHGAISGRHYWSLGVNVIFGKITGKTKWTLGNNSVFSPFLASGALVTMQGPNWGLVNNVFVWSGPISTPYQAIAETGAGTDPKVLRFNAFVRFDKANGALYLNEGVAAVTEISALNQMVDLPLCGFGNNIAISTLADSGFLCLQPLSPDFLKLTGLSQLVDGGIQLGYGCGGIVVSAPATDITGKDVPCGSARDIGAYEFCP